MHALTRAVRFASVLAISGALVAQSPPKPQPYCIRGVALDRAGARKANLVLRDGAIEAVLDVAAPAPPGTRVVDGSGLVCLPAFLDAFSRQGCTVPQPVTNQDVPPNVLADVGIDMRIANRKGIQPAFRAAEALAIQKEQGEGWRKSGFGAALIAPGGELLAGVSALAATREAAMRDLVVRDEVFAHAAFAASGPGYPTTLMGYFAQLRQFLLDSQHHVELERRHAQGRPGLRPPFDSELAAGAELIRGGRRLLCEANSAADILRWCRLADEFDLDLAIAGGLEAWRVRDELARRAAMVVLTLDWGKEVKDPRPASEEDKEEEKSEVDPSAEPSAQPGSDEEPAWEYTEPLAVRSEHRRRWEEKRDCALRLHEVGVPFVFGTASEKPAELLKRVRALVKKGLPAEAALHALTEGAAEFLGVAERLGRIEPGRDATFALWRSDPLTDEKASPAWVFVDGFPSEFPEEKAKGAGGGPAEGVDVTGRWTLEFQVEGEGIRKGDLELQMEESGALSGSLEVDSPTGGARTKAEVEGQVSGREVELECTLDFGGFEVEVTLTAQIDGDELDGQGAFLGPSGGQPMSQSFRGKRAPEQEIR